MKKIVSLLGVAALAMALTLVSCKKTDDPNNPNGNGGGSTSTTIAKGTIMADRILFHDSINGTYFFWKLETAEVGISRTSTRKCDKGRLSCANTAYIGVLTQGGNTAVMVENGYEIGPLSFDFNAPHWPPQDGDYADVPFSTMQYDDEFMVGLRYFNGWENKAYYGWAKGRLKHVMGGNDYIEWLEVYYETRNNTPIKAGAK